MRKLLVIDGALAIETSSDFSCERGEVITLKNGDSARCLKVYNTDDTITYHLETPISKIEVFPSDIEDGEITMLKLSQEDIAMLKNELGYSRCLIWDNKLQRDDFCDGECFDCKTPYKIGPWLKSKNIPYKSQFEKKER